MFTYIEEVEGCRRRFKRDNLSVSAGIADMIDYWHAETWS